MKIDRLETHDRLLHFKKDQSTSIAQGVEDCLKVNSLSLALQDKSPYIYIFAHPRTADDGLTKVMYWQPRLSKPKAQTNSYLFRVPSKTDLIEICWMLPPREMKEQFEQGKVTENEIVNWSYQQFDFNRDTLEAPHPEDLPEEKAAMILHHVIADHKSELLRKGLYNANLQAHLGAYEKI